MYNPCIETVTLGVTIELLPVPVYHVASDKNLSSYTSTKSIG